jgi:hypothetical protein
MEIEIHPHFQHKSHETLYDYLDKILYNKKNNEINIIIEKYNYIAYYSDEGIYEIYNDEIHKSFLNNTNKVSIDKIIPFFIQAKKNTIERQLYINYNIHKPKNKINNISLSCLPFHHISNTHTKYTLHVSKHSKTKCEIIFNKKTLIDIIFYIELPSTNLKNEEDIQKYIISCIQNSSNNLHNVYNECFYSLYSLIINML